jgi:large subunit ribosomal protein L29
MMKATEVRDMSTEQIHERMVELREELFRLRIRSSFMELENPQLPKTIRRDIARMKTILRQRELAGGAA